jgi:hypothetical protein
MDLLWKIPVGRFESRRIQFQVRRQEPIANRRITKPQSTDTSGRRVAGGVGFELHRIGADVVQLTFANRLCSLPKFE